MNSTVREIISKEGRANIKLFSCNGNRIVPKTCTGVTIIADVIDAIVWNYIGSLLEDLSDVKQALELLKDKREKEYDIAAIDPIQLT